MIYTAWFRIPPAPWTRHATAATWSEAWRLLCMVHPPGAPLTEKIVPLNDRHPDERRKPR